MIVTLPFATPSKANAKFGNSGYAKL